MRFLFVLRTCGQQRIVDDDGGEAARIASIFVRILRPSAFRTQTRVNPGGAYDPPISDAAYRDDEGQAVVRCLMRLVRAPFSSPSPP
jgi:hypothetical protein